MEQAGCSSPGQGSWKAARPLPQGSSTSPASALLFLPPPNHHSQRSSSRSPCPSQQCPAEGLVGSAEERKPRLGFPRKLEDLAQLPTPPPSGSPPATARPAARTETPVRWKSGQREGGKGKKKKDTKNNNNNKKKYNLHPRACPSNNYSKTSPRLYSPGG